MESVGRKLREARLRQGLGLQHVSSETRISVKYLEAIETDDLAKITSPFAYRSFGRQFAQCLGIQSAEFESALKALSQTMPEPLVPGQIGAPMPPDVPSLRPQPTRKLRWALSFFSLIAMLVGCSNLYAIWQQARPNFRLSVEGLLNSLTAHPASRAESRNMSHPAASSTPGRVSVAVPVAQLQGFRIQLSTIENTWLSLAADGKEVFSGLLHASETRVLEGREIARIRAGNAGGVELVFNGRALGPLGRRGQVRTVVFTKNAYEVLEPEAHAWRMLLRPDAE